MLADLLGFFVYLTSIASKGMAIIVVTSAAYETAMKRRALGHIECRI
jgi:hypothetical protein